MGTNFYFGKKEEIHIGKRSAAGFYCWDCGVTLCNSGFATWKNKTYYGTDAVHTSGDGWLDSCPICGKKIGEETLSNSSAGRELGFNESKPEQKTGVKSCGSFTWAISPKEFQTYFRNRRHIYDEYGRKYSKQEFIDILKECPIKFYGHVGVEFS